MKKTVLFVCASLCISTIVSAQIKKGSVFLGGSISLSNSNGNNETDTRSNQTSKTNVIYFNPTVGIAVKENWVAGITASFNDYESKQNNDFSYDREIESYSVGLFVRRYLALGKKFYLYGNGSISFQISDDFETNNNFNENLYYSKGVSLSITPGITYAINNRFHLEASLNNLLTAGYSHSRTRHTRLDNGMITNFVNESKHFSFATNFNTSAPLSIGFRFVLGK